MPDSERDNDPAYLRSEIAERMRVNVGLLAENKMLRRLHADRSGFERQVAGGLRSCIDAHGPLTPNGIGSASKRITKQVYAWMREQMNEDVQRLMGTTEEQIAARFDGSSARALEAATRPVDEPKQPELLAEDGVDV